MKNNQIILALIACIALGFSSCKKADDFTIPEKTLPVTTGYSAEKNSSDVNKLVAQVRQATVKYLDHEAALDDGFFNTHECVAIPGVGGMGVHFVKFDRVDDVHNPLEPEVLVYEIKNNDEYKLVAVEYLHVGNTPPMFGGEIDFHPFPQPQADFALHVWAWKANPSGIFADWNPNVSCQ